MVLREIVMSNMVYILLIELCLFIALLILNLRENKEIVNKFFKSIRRERNILIFMLLFVLFVFAIQMFYMCTHYSHHKIFTLTVARGFTEGETNLFYNDGSSVRHQNDIRDPYSYGSFYPFTASVILFIFGVNSYYIYILDALAGALMTLFVFLLLFVLTKDKKISIYGMIISGSVLAYYTTMVSAETILQFFLFLYSMCLFLLFFSLKKNTFLSYSLFLVGSLFLIQTRAGGFVILFAFILGLLLYRLNDFKKVKFWLGKILPAIIVFSVFLPIPVFHYASHYFYDFQEPGSSSFTQAANSLFRIFDFETRINSVITNTPVTQTFISDFINFWTQPFLLPTLLFVFVGLVFTLKNKRKPFIILFLLFLSHNLIYLLWQNGYQMRYAMLTIIPYFAFASLGLIPLKNLILKYKDRFKPLVLYFPNHQFRFKPLLFIIPIYLLVVLGFFTAYIIENQSICETNPLDISEFESALQPFTEDMKSTDANILVLGTEVILSDAEFVLVKNVFNVNDHVYYNYFIADPILNSTYGRMMIGGGLASKPELQEEREKLFDLSFRLSIEDIINNKEKRTKLINEIIRENTYLVTGCEYMKMKEVKYTFEMMDKLFDLELLHEKNCFYIYRVKEMK